jgi:hypothetical protein
MAHVARAPNDVVTTDFAVVAIVTVTVTTAFVPKITVILIVAFLTNQDAMLPECLVLKSLLWPPNMVTVYGTADFYATVAYWTVCFGTPDRPF